MQPDEWLALAKKHIETPEEISDEELAQLRSNYDIWNGALGFIAQEVKTHYGTLCKIVFGGRRFTPEEWNTINDGNFPPELNVDEEKKQSFMNGREDFLNGMFSCGKARSHMRFLKEFDKYSEEATGAPAPEIQEILWKTKADRLQKAIEDHRHAHVLANKQPNGLDFALWQEADLGDFNASSHAGLQQNGYIGFKEI